MSLQLVANHLAQKGRGPDSTLVHMSNREVAGLQALAKKHGGELTVNPDTGLPEAGFLDSLLPTIAGAGLTYFSGGAINPMMAAGIVGGISALDSKDLGKGLMAGLGAWGGGSMVGGLAGMGLVGEGAAATATTPASEAAMKAAINEGTYKNAVGQGASNFGSMFANKPMDTIASFGGGSGLNAGRTLFAAAAPAIMADQNVKTTTPAPERGKIRPYTFNAQQMNPSQTGPVSGERRYFNNEFTAGDPYSAANGGLVALARGGYAQQPLFRPTTPLPENNMYGASRTAYDYLMGATPPSGGQLYDPIRDIRIDDGKNLNPNTPKTGKGRYEFDPVTGQYKWIPDPITPIDVAPPVFQPTTPIGGGGGGGRSPEEQQRINDYFDNMTPEQREEHAKTLSTGMDVLGNLMPGSWIPKAASAVQTFFKEQQLKDIYAKEAADAEAKRIKEESDNLLRMIQETNQSIYNGTQVTPRTAPVTPESEQVQQAIADTNFTGMDRGSTPTQERTPDTQAVQNDINKTDFSGMDRGNTAPPSPAPSAPAPSAPSSDPGNGGGAGGVGGGGAGRDGGGGGGFSGSGAAAGSSTGPAAGTSNGGESGGWGSRDAGGGGGDARGGYYHHNQFNYHPYAQGGIAALNQYNLGSYSDGGRLLKGPGDGVSDDVPAIIGHNQPARLADNEFVIPARIVSEIGNGSTDAGARALYKMMDRIQQLRSKTVGKGKIAVNSKAYKELDKL